MIQGTGSHVGKSVLAAALCRILRQDGHSVAPFKAQNMSNNAYVCDGGGEIARSQALQAAACGIEPTVDMNPVLLKPSTDEGAQVIIQGRPGRTMKAREYETFKASLVPIIQESLARLRAGYEFVIIEGAGSPAEINLRDTDIANMKTAALADAPVILVGDIDFGGVFAQLIGTMHLLLEEERARVCGFVINKFRGDIDILKPGLDFLEKETGKPIFGTLPYFKDIRLPEEDSIAHHRRGTRSRDIEEGNGRVRIDVIRHPRIANFTDFDALAAEPDVSLRYVERPDGLIPDVILIPGTKSTISDLRQLKKAGFAEHIHRCHQNGATIAGICGGFQMMGNTLRDPHHVESSAGEETGLGLLPTETIFCEEKQTARVRGIHLESGAEVSGYEIHMGQTSGGQQPAFEIRERLGAEVKEMDGASAGGGRVWGTYIHGVFDSAPFRAHFINSLCAGKGLLPIPATRNTDLNENLDRLAEVVRENLDMNAIYEVMMGVK